jgi:hypothetical protein
VRLSGAVPAVAVKRKQIEACLALPKYIKEGYAKPAIDGRDEHD